MAFLSPWTRLLTPFFYRMSSRSHTYAGEDYALRSAALALGEAGEFGTLTVGGRGDLLLLAADPLQDVAHVREPLGVMVNGRWLPQAELQHMLDQLAASFEPSWLERLWPVGLLFLGWGVGRRRVDTSPAKSPPER